MAERKLKEQMYMIWLPNYLFLTRKTFQEAWIMKATGSSHTLIATHDFESHMKT